MAREAVPNENDVDEEVFHDTSNEGVEAAAEASRAVHDAHQAGQLDISGEAKKSRALRSPRSSHGWMVRDTTRVPSRDWCRARCSLH